MILSFAYIYLLTLLLFASVYSNDQYVDYNIQSYERQALKDLYSSTNGNHWIYKEVGHGYWDFTDPNVNPCLSSNVWQGLNCTVISDTFSNNSYIYEIRLPYYNLTGSIPDSIGNFTYLQYLNISHNLIDKSIPDTIGKLSHLLELDLSENSITGTLPENIYNLSTLQVLNLNNTRYLHGTLSNLIKQLCNLQVLYLGLNSFDGKIPDTIGNLVELIEIDISYNSFEGRLPESFYNLTALQVLNLDGNDYIEGTLSNSIGKLSKLRYINLRNNLFEGTIPETIGNLFELTYLRTSTNQLTGTIPNSICNLTSLTLLSFSYNQLKGTIPSFIGRLSMLQYFSIYTNYISGIIPSFLANAKSLFLLDLASNLLTGSIPHCIGGLSSLRIIYFNLNQLTGRIPYSISQLNLLEEIYLHDNNLVNSIPNIFSNLEVLESMLFHNNHLTGTLPSSISQLLALKTCFFQNNHLEGKLDKVFNGENQIALANIQLSYNQFSGKLSTELFSSKKLIAFSAVENCFHGSIPSNICDNTQLISLSLDGLVCASSCRNKIASSISDAYISDSQITGGIPDCLWSMPKLEILHLSGNGLTGTIPNDINIGNSLVDLSLSYNLLTGSIPTYIQDRQWHNLDLSHNRLSGTLRSHYVKQYDNASLELNNNRISGIIPNSLHGMNNISILQGNSYDCKYDRSDLPTNDDNYDSYECGSKIFNVLYFIWLAILFALIIILTAAWYSKDRIIEYVKMSDMINKLWKWIHIIEYVNELDIIPMANKMQYFKQYYNIQSLILTSSMYSTLFIIAFLLPAYTILSLYYATHTYQYAWTASILYLSGSVSFGVIMSMLLIFTIMRVYIYWYKLYQNKHKLRLGSLEQNTDLNIFNSKLGERQSYRWYRWRIYSMYMLYISINFIVVSGFNAVYVYLVLYQSNKIVVVAQILLSIFKMIWNSIVSPRMVRWIVNYLSSLNIVNRTIQRRLFILQLVVSLFNNIIIPCVIVAIVSPNCFYHIFGEEKDVTSSFTYSSCTAISQSGYCKKYTTIESSVSYNPPFIYSYQCSTDFVSYYASVFVFICIFSTFIIPVGQIYILQLSMKYKWISKYVKISVLFHIHSIDITTSSMQLLYIDDIYEILVSLLTFFGLLLTFGAVFPPLAVAFLITIYRRIYFHKAIIGRYLSYVVEQKLYTCLDIIEEDCKVVQLLAPIIHLCGWILLAVSFMFYTLFLFDILGDEVGINGAYWILIIMPSIPITIYISFIIYIKYIPREMDKVNNNTSVNTSSMKSIDGIELSSSVAMISNPLNNLTSEIDQVTVHSSTTSINIIQECGNNDGMKDD